MASYKGRNRTPPKTRESRFDDLGRTMRGKDWIREFERGFSERVGDRRIDFKARRYPNVMYVFGDEIERVSYRGEALAGATDTDHALDLLIRKNVVIEDLARGGLTVPVTRLTLRQRHSGDPHASLYNVGALVQDVASSAYREGYVMVAEKEAIRERVNVSHNQPTPEGVPGHFLVLGTITCREEVMGDQLFHGLRSGLAEEIELGPITAMDAHA